MDHKRNAVDPRSGFNSVTRTFHTLRPLAHLPPETLPLSAADFALSRLRRNSPRSDSVAFIDSATRRRVLFSEFTRWTETLAANLRSSLGLSKGDVAFVLSPNLVRIPVLYFALLSIGAVISAGNPISTESEIAALVQLCKPKLAFATSATARKMNMIKSVVVVIVDSAEFESLMTATATTEVELEPVRVNQSDLASIMYSSGTTGRVKGVETTHRNLIAMTAGYHARGPPGVVFYAVPYFHMYGLFYCVKSVAVGEAVAVMERFEMRKMLRAVEEFRVTCGVMVPPIVVAMTKGGSTADYDLSSLETIICGAAPLGKEVILKFKAKFPNVALLQGYGLTESTGAVSRTVNPEESLRYGAAGRLCANLEAKIVDPETGLALPPCKQGELWIRGPSVMKGYVGDEESTGASLVGGGWLRTGDLCYIDDDGFLYVVDRLKELIKVKAYQVAPAELEQLLQSHPDVLDAAVIPYEIGYPDEEAGEVPMAIVVKRPKCSLGESQVMEFVGQQVSPYKKIRRVAFVDSIPKTASGKILRRELRNTFRRSSTPSRL